MPNRISRSSALPVDLFANEPVFDLELGEIWQRDWIFATTVDAVADPGDFVAVMIGRQPVIVVRGEDYALRAIANVCSHRGMRLVDCSGSASRFSCPYHAWTYDHDGDLLSVPYALPNEVDQRQHGLEAFRVEQWHGLVFVNLDVDAGSLQERLHVIDAYVKPLGVDRFHHDVRGETSEVWNANWKLIFANAMDSYSHFRVHSETVEPTSPTDAAYYLAGSAHATVSGGESAERADHLVISLPPSFVAIVYPDSMLWQALVPLGVGTTEVRIGLAGEKPGDDGSVVSLPGWEASFIDEDRSICERLQANAAVRSRSGPLLEIERPLADFHDYLAWRLAKKSPEPPVVAALPGDRPEPPHLA